MIAFLSKETLFWIPYTVDLVLCLVQFPMFALKGAQGMMDILGTDGTSAPKKDDDDKKNVVTKAYAHLFDLFLLCYSGYCAMMYYGLYSIISYPGELTPVFGAVMFGVNLAKFVVMWRWEKRDGETKELRNSKKFSLLVFDIPFYGGYSLLCFLQRYVN